MTILFEVLDMFDVVVVVAHVDESSIVVFHDHRRWSLGGLGGDGG